MNGDSRETGKLTQEGKPDPSVFSTEYNREGIRVGTAVCLMVRQEQRRSTPTVRFRHFWGVSKRTDLLESLKTPDFNAQYEPVTPDIANRFTFRPSEVAAHYREWPKLVELCAEAPIQGMDEDRANALIRFIPDELTDLMSKYFDKDFKWEQFVQLKTGLARNSAAFEPDKVREKALSEDRFNADNVRRYLFRPYDNRWCYYTHVPNVWKRPRPELFKQSWKGNGFLLSRPAGVASPEGVPFLFTKNLIARDSMRGHAIAFPIRLRPTSSKKAANQNNLFMADSEAIAEKANLSPAAWTYLAALGLPDPDADTETGGLIWMHALAVGYASAYLTENADGIRQDWPRVPLPDTAEALKNSAALGREIAALLDTENPVPGVTAGAIRPELKVLGVITREGGGSLNPDAGDLALTAGWGYSGKDGVTMPGKGKAVKRDYTAEERAAIREGAPVLGLTVEAALEHLGESTYDIYLNEVANWRNIPEKVWNYYIGGYQVIKKWLSYRERPLLGRPLTPGEIEEVTHMARRLAAIVLLEPALNANYQRIKARAYAWPRQQG
jgi:hypothetical protein